jgi:PIN domain nuclease of toxin-antitoxin system
MVSIWEIAIKQATPDNIIEAGISALQNGYGELNVLGRHVVAGSSLPPIHKDPFDRLLIAQAMVEGITLLTADAVIARYPGPIKKV